MINGIFILVAIFKLRTFLFHMTNSPVRGSETLKCLLLIPKPAM